MIKKLSLLLLLFAPFTMVFGYYAVDRSYVSGPYFGAGGGFVWVQDILRYKGTTFLNGRTRKKADTETGIGQAYLGYGKVFDQGNLPYLGIELGYSYPANYSKKLNLGKINANHTISLDLMPGWFFDDDNTTLIYGRLGAGGTFFRFKGMGYSKSRASLVLRAGGGIEHNLTGNFYVRAGYTLMYFPNKISFKVNNGLDKYSSEPLLQIADLGISYHIFAI